MKPKQIFVNSMVASKTGEPRVTLRLGDEYTDMSLDQAREIESWLLEAAEAAECDSFLVGFTQEEFELDQGQAVKLLRIFREYREKRRKKHQSE